MNELVTFFQSLMSTAGGATLAVGLITATLGYFSGRGRSRAEVTRDNAEAHKLIVEAHQLEKTELEEAEQRTQKQIIQGFESLAKSYSDSLDRLKEMVQMQSKQLAEQSLQLDGQGRQLTQLRSENTALRREVHDLQTHINVMVAAMRTDTKNLPDIIPDTLVVHASRILSEATVEPDCAHCKYDTSCDTNAALKVLRIAGRMCGEGSTTQVLLPGIVTG